LVIAISYEGAKGRKREQTTEAGSGKAATKECLKNPRKNERFLPVALRVNTDDESRWGQREESQRGTTEYGYVVCQGEPVVESSSENFEKEKGGQVGWTLSFPFS
jgi:hypothetical protein